MNESMEAAEENESEEEEQEEERVDPPKATAVSVNIDESLCKNWYSLFDFIIHTNIFFLKKDVC